MAFSDVDADDLDFESDQLEERLAVLKRENSKLKSANERTLAQLADMRELLNFHDVLASAAPKPPKWLAPKGKKGKADVVACTILSDCHFDEVVRPEELGWVNCYNREIATMRLMKWAQGFIAQNRDYLSGLNFVGAVVALGGDIFSGGIHDELRETNEDTLFGSLLYWSEQIIAAIELIADFFGRVHVPCVVGNHGRMTRKPRSKLRARDNVDWLLAHMVKNYFAGDDRVTVEVTDDTDCFFTVFDTVHLLTHGDQVKGGGGIGGIWPPIMRMIARKQVRYAHQPFDVVVMGHWHQLIMSPSQGLIVNGSTKGYDEFAATNNFRPERAQQGMWIVTPQNGITWTGPIFCDDREAEGW